MPRVGHFAQPINARLSGSRSASATLDAQVPIFLIQGMLRFQAASPCRLKKDSRGALQRPARRYRSKAPTGHRFRRDRSLAVVLASPTSVKFSRPALLLNLVTQGFKHRICMIESSVR